MVEKKLSIKQKLFADCYIELLNATAAAIKAGYSKKTARVIGQENLQKPAIKKYIDKQIEEMQSNQIAASEEVLKYLTSVMRGKDQNIGIKDRLKAAELLGKRYGLFTEKVSVSTEGLVVIHGGQDIED